MLLFAPMGDERAQPGAGGAGALAGGPVALVARIRGGAGGRAALWWWSGTVFGRRAGELAKPLLTVTGIGFSRFSREPDGTWRFAMSEAGYFADLATGEFLREWVNPWTGRTLEPPPNRLMLRYTIGEDGRIAPPIPGVPFDGQVGPAVASGDSVWVTERLMASFPKAAAAGPDGKDTRDSKHAGPTGNPVEFSTFQARASDLAGDASSEVPATMHHQAAWGFYPWLGMAGEAGDVITQIVGRKVAGPGELPVPLRERVEREYPGLLADPGI